MQRHWHEDEFDQLTPDDVQAYCVAARDYVSERDDFGYTPLIAACMRAKPGFARVLLEAGADPNFNAPDGESPLKAAIPKPDEPFNREVFDLLFAAGANPNLGLEPPLHIAVARGHRDLVKYLVQHGADPNLEDSDGDPPLFWASGWGGRPDIRMMRVLIALGADVTRRNGVGRTMEECIGRDAMHEAMRRNEE